MDDRLQNTNPAGSDTSSTEKIGQCTCNSSQEENCADERQRYKTLLGNLPGIAYQCLNTPDWPMRFISNGCRELTGYSARELTDESGVNFGDLVVPEDRGAIYEQVQAAVARNRRFQLEYRITDRNGGEKWVWEQGVAAGKMADGTLILEGFITDVSDRKRAEFKVKELNRKLAAILDERTYNLSKKTRELEKFTYRVSHDLKAPLRAVNGYAGLLKKCAQDLGEKGEALLDNIGLYTEQMNDIIDALLTYSRIDLKPGPPSPVNLEELIDAVRQDNSRKFEGRQIRWAQDIPVRTITAVPKNLRLILTEILDNALVYTRNQKNTAISLKARNREAFWEIQVEDNGIGFEPRYETKIFEIFQRLHTMKDYPGVGMGLAMADKAARQMGATISASGSPGKGARFIVRLPKDQI